MASDALIRALAPRFAALSAGRHVAGVRPERVLLPRLAKTDPLPRLSRLASVREDAATRTDGGGDDGPVGPTHAEVRSLRERVDALEAAVGADDEDPGSPF